MYYFSPEMQYTGKFPRKGERYTVSSRYDEYERSLKPAPHMDEQPAEAIKQPSDNANGEASVAHGASARIASDEAHPLHDDQGSP